MCSNSTTTMTTNNYKNSAECTICLTEAISIRLECGHCICSNCSVRLIPNRNDINIDLLLEDPTSIYPKCPVCRRVLDYSKIAPIYL